MRETGCPEYHVYKCPSHAPIAVREGVNRFELSMCQGCCGYRRQLCGGEEPDEIVHETRNGFGNRRHVNGADWVNAIAPNPVLVDPQASTLVFKICPLKQDTVELTDDIQCYIRPHADAIEAVREHVQVA